MKKSFVQFACFFVATTVASIATLHAQSTSTRNNILKVSALSPVFGHASLHYERIINKNNSVELTGRFIGVGTNEMVGYVNSSTVNRDAKGKGIGVAYKYTANVSVETFGFSPDKISTGFYLKPSIEVGTYSENHMLNRYDVAFLFEYIPIFSVEPMSRHRTVNYSTFLVALGNQTVLFDRVTLDMNVGLGIAPNGPNSGGIQQKNFGTRRFSIATATADIRFGYKF
jgi:hypothetical protein